MAHTKFLKLPLALAITALFVSACSTKPRYQSSSVTSPVVINAGMQNTNSVPVYPNTTNNYNNPNPPNSGYNNNSYNNNGYNNSHSNSNANNYASGGLNINTGNIYSHNNNIVNNNANTNNYDNVATDSGLDAETLEILNDLLEARDMSMVEGDQLTIQRFGNLWDRVRMGYKIPQPKYSQRIEAQKEWFSARQAYLDRLTARASRYLHYTVTEAERRGIPTELALLPIIESSYDPAATSNAAAAGLWQFIPSTGRIYGLNQTQNYDGRRDVIESTRAAYDFLTTLYNRFGSWELALASYNAGPGRIQRAIDANRSAGLSTDYWSLRLPAETMNYVPRFMAVAQIVGNPSQHGVYLPAIANHTHFRAVPVNYGVSLYDVASITGVSLDELQLLNPALINFRVDGAGPNRVVIPDSVAHSVDAKLNTWGGRTAPMPNQKVEYVAPNHQMPNTYQASNLTQDLYSNNTLPTTAAALTVNDTVVQEPPLTAEELNFIAQQIKVNTPEPIAVINATDNRIDLNAVQTNQSVLDARGQKKSLQYDANASVQSKAKQTTYIVKRGDSLGKIAQAYGVSVSDLAKWNQLNPNANLFVNTKLKLYDANPSNQSPSTNRNSSRNDTSYIVQSGDTLTGVASKYNMSVTQLANYNNLTTTSGLITGQTLWLVDGKVKSTKTPSQNNATTNYTVKSGDTLIGLAKELGVTAEDIAKLNEFDSNAGLIQGRTIKVPATKSNKAQSDKNQSTKADTKIDTNQGRTLAKTENYKVKKGESLTSLASQYNVSVEDLAKTNNLSPKAGLRVGQVIKVPKFTDTYTVKSGDTLIGLARQYGVSTDELATMNNIKSTTQLKRGQKLTVPNR